MQSMDEIYRKYADTVYKYLMSLTRDEDVSEELTQETFYQAIRTSDRFNGKCAVSTWLCGIAKNVLMTYRRRHPPAEDVEEQIIAVPSAEAAAVESSDRVEIFRKLHALSEPYREVVYLRVFGGLSFREIGEVHGNSENWARVTYYRGREKLRKRSENDE